MVEMGIPSEKGHNGEQEVTISGRRCSCCSKKKDSHVKSSCSSSSPSSSSRSSSSSSSSSKRSPHHHGKHHGHHHDKHLDKHHDHHHDKHHDKHQHGDEAEVVSKNRAHDNAQSPIVEEIAAPEEFAGESTINGAVDEDSDSESSASVEEASAIEEVEKVEQATGIRDESEVGGDGAVEGASSSDESDTKEYHVDVSETNTSEPALDMEIEALQPEDDVTGIEISSKIEDTGDAEFVTIVSEEVGESEPAVAEDVINEKEEQTEDEKEEEELVEKREISDAGSEDDEKHAESVDTEEVAESESVVDSAKDVIAEETIFEKHETSESGSEEDEKRAESLDTDEVAESEVVDDFAKDVIEEEAVFEKRETSDAVSEEGEKRAESVDTEEVAESEVVDDSAKDVIEEEAVFEKQEDSESVSEEDERHAEFVAAEQVTESEVVGDSAKDMTEDEAVVEMRKTSDVAAEEEGNHVVSTEKSVLGETEQVSQNANASEQHVSSNSLEIEGKTGHDEEHFEGEESEQTLRSHFPDLSVQVASPLELKNHLLKPPSTASPPKRENSVYKIVMALESGLQVGEKCIHGEIDHGVCHQRYGDKRSSSPGSFSPTLRDSFSSRDSSTSPRNSFRGEPSPPEVHLSSDGAREIDNEWSFVQHDSSSSVTQVASASTKTETYTDTVLFRRDDGFLPRTPGRSPLSQESMRAVFSQVEGSSSSSDTPTLKIVHEFPAEHESESVVTTTVREGESEVERILRIQETHDLVCPVCRSCITKRVILRKRKRTTTVSSVETWEREVVEAEDESSGEEVVDAHVGEQTVVEEHENYGCLNCFTFLFRRERITQRTEGLEVPRVAEEVSGAPVVIPVAATVPPAPTGDDYDNHCLPIFFTWRRKMTTSTDSEIVAPLLSKEEKEEESSDVRTESRDVSTEDVLQQSTSESKEITTSESKEITTSESKEISTAESKEISTAEIEQASTSETERPDAGTLTLPPAPGVAEGFQIPVVVVESREDRLCFPFLWRRATKYSQVHPELSQPLLKEDAKQKVDEVEQQATETKEDVKQESKQTEDFSRIEDDFWMRGEVLHVPVSVSPEEEPQTPVSSSQTPSVTTTRVTEEERRADCLCFPSWSSSETTTEQTEISSEITNFQQGASSLTETTEKIQTSTSQGVIASTDLKKVVTSPIDGSEIIFSSPSFKGAVASGEDSEAQKAGLNCLEILVPPYPWGPAGGERTEEVTEDRTGIPSMNSFQFSTVGYSDGDNSIIVPVAGSSKKPEFQPNQSIVVAQSTERREDSTCFPLSLPALSWRRQELISGEIVDGSSKAKATEVKSSEAKSAVSSETKSSTSSETKSWVTTETRSWVTSETKSSGSSESTTAETGRPKGELPDREFDFGEIEASRNQGYGNSAVELVEEEEEEPLVRKSPASSKKLEPEPLPVEVKERVTVGSEEIDDNRGSLPEILNTDLSFSQDLTSTENVLPVGEDEPQENGSWLTSTENVLPAGEDEPQENGSWNCCLPSYSQLAYQPIGSDVAESVTVNQAAAASVSSDALPGASISHVSESTVNVVDTKETVIEEESREKGSWSCCLPSYTQFAYQPITDRVPETDVLSGASISDESESTTYHEEVTKETTIDARIKTEVKTTTFSTDEEHAESIDSVRVDTTVSYVHGKVQHDDGVAEGTLLLDDRPTLTFHPVNPDSKPDTGDAALPRFLEEDESDTEVNERVAALSSQDAGKKESVLSEAVTETGHDIGEVVSGEVEGDGARGRVLEEEEDGSCCGPSSKWYGTQLWGRWKFTTEEAQLREPLLGSDSAKSTILDRDSEADSQDSAHITIQQTHEVTETRTGDHVEVATEDDRCHCFPWSRRELADNVGTTVTVIADETVIQVEGADASSTLAAATQAAEDAGMIMEEPLLEGGYLKSIVYGGLDVSLTSLGVVAAAAGGDAKTRNILALGLSNLIFGFLAFFYKLQDMHKERPVRFHESVGPRFFINGPLAMLSFLFFGALPVLAFAFSFRHMNDHDYKMAATVLASTIAVIFLGCGKVAAKMTELSYRRTLTTLIVTGIVASVAAFYTGEYISKLLTKYGIFDE